MAFLKNINWKMVAIGLGLITIILMGPNREVTWVDWLNNMLVFLVSVGLAAIGLGWRRFRPAILAKITDWLEEDDDELLGAGGHREAEEETPGGTAAEIAKARELAARERKILHKQRSAHRWNDTLFGVFSIWPLILVAGIAMMFLPAALGASWVFYILGALTIVFAVASRGWQDYAVLSKRALGDAIKHKQDAAHHGGHGH